VVRLSFARDQARVRAFIWSNGVMTDLGTLGGSTGQAYALGNGGRVVGYADTSTGSPHGFLFTLNSAGNVSSRTDLGAGSGAYSYAWAINSLGQAVGTNGHAVLWQDGVMSDLNTLIPPDTGWVLMSATAINDRGEIAGWGTYQGFTRAFVLRR
jgi:probable HAF family extracellular repeat protein